ncbi:MAG TPA: hypothetical protein VEJ63_11820 [Planctomycetota bacterium]|nr:hypothetical protein [Planctomycetota bacterium]
MRCAAIFLIFIAQISWAEDAQDLSARFAALLKKLGGESFADRQNASDELLQLPPEALRLIKEALELPGTDAEVKTRLRKAVPEFESLARAEEKKQVDDAIFESTMDNLVGSYKRVGKKDAKWDKLVLKGLEALAKNFTGRDSSISSLENACILLKKAIDSGCDDPLVAYAYARTVHLSKNTDANLNLRKLHIDAVESLLKSEHSQTFKIQGCMKAGEIIGATEKPLQPESQNEIDRYADLALQHARSTWTGKKLTPALKQDVRVVVNIFSQAYAYTGNRMKGVEKLLALVKELFPESNLAGTFRGEAYVKYAWDARGSGWASTVTDEGWKLMRERLAVAEEALTAAWKHDPKDVYPPLAMIGVELGQGKGRDVMELWFKRACDADPGNYEVYLRKLYYLEPKWHGSEEDLLSFGKECLASNKWAEKVPFILVDAHNAVCRSRQNNENYFENPNVYSDIKEVYEGYLKRFPSDHFRRSEYAKYAHYCGDWNKVHELFTILGDNADWRAFNSAMDMVKLRVDAQLKTKKQATSK